ncbi:MAG TPA: hypothetical protein VD772_05080, partial [Anseongella sp.]|nr:hypothetical protein [Anseongella sp.]
RENLEFISDRQVLQSGIDARTYQYSLVKVSEIPHVSSLANNFNFSHLKIRITMMDKKPSPELHLVKYLVLVPILAATALAFNVSKAGPNNPVNEIVKLTGLVPAGDTLPEKAPPYSSSAELYEDNFTIYGDKIPSEGSIGYDDPVILDGKLTTGREAEEALAPGRKGLGFAAKLENGLARYYVPGKDLVYWLETKSAGEIGNRPDFPPPPPPVVEEVRVSPSEITPGKKDSPPPPKVTEVRFSPLKVARNEENGGTSAKAGGVSIATFTPPIILKKDNASGNEAGIDTSGVPLVIIDGKERDYEDLEGIPPGSILQVDVLKDAHAAKAYGAKGKNGVLLISTKKGARTWSLIPDSASGSLWNSHEPDSVKQQALARSLDPLAERVVIGKKSPNSIGLTVNSAVQIEDALIVIDGKISSDRLEDGDVKNLNPNDIKSISVLKGRSATDIYGEKGKNGVILITTKDKKE